MVSRLSWLWEREAPFEPLHLATCIGRSRLGRSLAFPPADGLKMSESLRIWRIWLTFPLDVSQAFPQHGAVLVFSGANKCAEREVFFVQFQASEHLGGFGILNGE